MKKRHFMMMLCALLVGGTMFSCASESGTDTPPELEVNENDVVAMTVRPASLSLDAGENETITVTYKKNNKGVAGGHISATSGNVNCFVINGETKSGYTGSNGEFEVILEAKNVTEACDGTVEITDIDGRVESRFVNVSVSPTTGGGGGGGTPTGDPELILLEPSNGQITLTKKDDKANIVVEYRNAKGKTQADTTIEIQNKDDACIRPAFGDITTGSNGQATLPITAKGENCTSLVTLTVGDVSAEVGVTVGQADAYFRTLKINYLNTGDHDPSNIGMRHNDVSNLIYGFGPDDVCPSDEDLLDRPQLSQAKTVTSSSFRQTNPFFTQKLELSRNKSPYSIIAYAENSAGELLAVGCVDGVGPDNLDDVTLGIYEVPILFGKEYDVTTNFDIFSRFKKESQDYKAEDMTAGDWVQFIIAFCKDPFGELISFVWDNSISRLADIEAIKSVDFLRNLLTSGTRELAKNALKDTIEPTLKKQTWYNVIDQVADDIADLTSNMQLKGRFEMGDYNNLTMSNMRVTFDQLEYQWSLEMAGQNGCIPDGVYGNSQCRRKLPLSPKDSTSIEGSCNASVTLSSDSGVDGYMTFSVSNLTFKWATILYSAIFGEILPSALGYKENNDNVKKGRYVSAFLESVLFKILINYYNENLANKPVEGKDINYPEFTSATYCTQFIEALVYLIWPDAAGYATTIGGVAGTVCSDGIMGKLDDYIENAFDRIQENTSQGLTMATTDCPLYSEDNVYKQIGKPDAGATVPTANEVFGSSKKDTNRCKWNVSVGSFAFDGLFHAEDNSL